jgi:hypothetical protein
MSTGLTVTKNVHFSIAEKGRREMVPGPSPVRDGAEGRVPRVSRLMALAIKFNHVLASGAVGDHVELAALGHVTRARVTQIMNLTHLAPDIQEAILYLPRVTRGRDPITERDVRAVATEVSWERQRMLWRRLGQDAAAIQAVNTHLISTLT